MFAGYATWGWTAQSSGGRSIPARLPYAMRWRWPPVPRRMLMPTDTAVLNDLTRRIIPCLDVTAGRVVKGVNFVDLRDAGDPVELAAFYDRAGADELVFLDITASSDSRRTVIGLVERTAEQVFIPLTVGGGVRSVEAIDARRDATAPSGWGVFTHGGRTPTGLDAGAWAREAVGRGAGEILLTSMDRDGTKDGYDLPLTRAIAAAVPVPVIASGGAGTLDHFSAVLAPGGADAALAASIFHFGEYSVAQVKRYLADHGVAVRL